MIEINDDAAAADIYTKIDNATGDERQQMADALIAYGEKKAKEEYNQADEHFSNLFLDDKYYNEQVNTPDLQQAYEATPFPKEAAKRAVLQGYLQHASGAPVSADTYEFIRDSYAQAKFGKTTVSDDEMFGLVRGEYDWQKQRTAAINDLQMQAVAKAITDSQLGQVRPFVDGMTEVFNQWQAKYPELVDGQNDAAFLSQGYKLYNDTINDLDTVRPQASKALSTLTAFTQGNATDEDMQSLANDFVSAPPEDRQKIYKYVTLAAQAGQIDRAGIEQFAVNMGQAFTRGFDFVPQGTLQMQEAGVNNWLESIRNGTQIWVPADGDLTKAVVGNAPAGAKSDAWRLATVPEAETLIQSGQNVRESFKVVRELRNVAKTGVDPIRPVLEEDTFWGTAERGAYGLAGSIPLMGATAVNPYLGVLAYQATEYDRIMLENPDIDPQFAQGLALVEGAANAAIDRVQLKSLSGKLPMFGRYLDRIKSDGIRRTIKIGANVVEQNLQEGAQDLIAPVLETAVAALREDMPDKDFTKLMDEWAGQRAETFFATLPLSLIGGGIATYQDIKNPSAELNATKLRQVGFDKEQVTFIQRAENPEEYTARIQMEWGNRKQENIEAGRQEVIAEMQKAATPGENDARISESIAEDGTRRWVVTAPDGRELLQTQDQQAALEAVRQHSEAQMINERNTVADMVDYFRAQDPTNTATIEAPRTVQQELDRLTEAGDAKGIANLNERIRFAGIPEGADLTTYNILGEANVETTAEGVFRGVIKLRENSRPEDAFEEINHVFVRKAIAEGRVTLDALRGWVTQTAEATGETYAVETETDIIENIAKIGMDYAAGRIEETSLPASFVDYIKRMLQVFKEAMARALKLKDAFATGKIDANFESFLAESVGLNQQTLADTVRDRAKTDIITDGGQMLMDFSIGSRTSAVSTDTPSIRASNATITGPANYSIGAFHGTPHKVDKFSTQKIGTGEGAQVYGWGLYFAEKFGVAKKYRDDLTSDPVAKINKHLSLIGLGGHSASLKLAEKLVGNGGDLSLASSEFRKEGNKQIADLIDKRVKEGRKSLNVNKGNIYTVELDVELEDMLDWDKPLSGQSPKVKAALQSVSDNWLWQDAISAKGGEQVGGALYSTLRATFPDAEFSRDGVDASKKASEALLAAGIPGIRYLDGGSRSEGQGTYNYVVFDENLIKITEENGNRIAATDALAAPATGATNYSIGAAPVKVSIEGLSEKPVQAREQIRSYIQKFLQGKELVLGDTDKKVRFTSESRGESISKARRVDQMAPMREAESIVAAAQWWKKTAPDDRAKIGTKEFWFFKVPIEIEGVVYNSHFNVRVPNAYPENTGVFYEFNLGKKIESNAAMGLEESSAPSFVDSNINIGTSATEVNLPVSNYSIGLSRNSISQVSDKDDPFRVGTAKLGTSKVPKDTPQDSNISGDNVPDDLLAKQMEKMNYAHLPKNILSEKDPKKKRRKLINWFKKNLLALHDAFPEEFRARATHWYDGANRIAKEMGNQFKASVEQASGVIAVFSPQKDWFMNVAQAEQFMELWTNSQDVVLEESLVRAEIEGIIQAATVADKQKRKKPKGVTETKEQTAERREYNKALDKLEKEKRRKIVEQVIGKTIRDLDSTPILQAWAIRVLAQVTFGRNYRNLSPEGDRLGMATNDDGALSKNGWGSTNEIEKAVRIMKDGSLKNISNNLGNEHKVRNFYNNIVAPNTPYGDATIDTHAVAAAHLMPYGAKATEVGHNFGSGMNGSEVLGISGVYHLYLDAYREAAADRGILPRQMQSITWEAIRLVYPAATKNATTLAKSQKTWKDLTDDNARNTLVGGRIPSPVWAGANDNGESQGFSSGLQENGSRDVSGGGLLSGVRPAGAGRDGGVNYSIASQSEIDRVNKALGGMNRGPDERLKVYERAKAKFSKLMAWNSDELAAMADTGSDDSQIRRTQILQALGELDGILSVLPAEVRGRVGGYTKLASIAPMDVLKDGVKISEVSGMKGALISAWMDQGLNIGQAGKKVDFPPGYTATENLSTKRADNAIADFFRDRIKRIDTELEKVLVREYTEAITKAVKQSRPKAGDNGVRKSTLGAETQKFADTVYRATLLDDEATAKRMAEIEAALTNPDATAEDVSALSEEWSILNTFGDLDNRSSETLAQGLDWLKGQLQMGREAWRIKEQARIDEQRARNAAAIEWLGKGTAKKRFADKGLMQRIAEVGNNYLLDHASFEQFVTAMLPPEIAANFSERLRKADMASQASEIRDGKGILDAVRAGAKAANMSAGDAMLWLKGDQKNAVSYLEGRKVKDERIAIELAQKIVTGEADRSKLTDADVETLRNELAALPADTQKEFVTIKRVIFRGEDVKLDMSRAKAIQLLLSWNQPDVQIKMRKEGWTDESAADLQSLVNDPVSREVMAYAKELYGKGAGIVNPVYSRMFGMNMPQVKNYAPTRFLNAKDTKDIGLDGSPTATGTTPGFAKSRVTHSAKIAPEDALTVMQGHIAQQAHWVHFAELAREFRALLSNPEVRESLKQTHGDAVLKSAELWADQLEQRGGNKARESAWLNNVIGTAISGKAVASLGFNLKTLAMQLENTIRFGLSLDMKQIASALSNPSTIAEDIQTVWESDAIQNRLQGGATAEARFLFSRYAGKPNFAAKIAEASMTPINWLDSAGTSISSAIVYRANLNDALAAGMPENLAKQAALNAASEAIYRFAQPVSFGQKSIMENNGNVFAKTFFLFMSDPRLKTAILADAARGLATGRGNASEHIRRIVAVELMALVSHVISSAFKDAFSDDDDEEIWGIGGFAKALLLAPFQGFFFAGSVAEVALSKLTGQGYFTSSQNPLLNTAESAIRAGSNLDDAFNFSDPEAMLKQWNNIFRSMAVTPTMAAPAVLLNMVKPVVGLYQNATTKE